MNTSSFTQRLVDQPLAATIDYYARHLNDHAHAFLKRNGLSADESLRVGFADRTLGNQIPSKQLKAGREIRTKLMQQGILKPNGHETLRGFVTVPLTDIEGTTTGLYGLRVDNKGKDQAQLTIGSGWFNAAALTSFEEIIVCANVLDAWTFHAAGHTNVVAVERGKLAQTSLVFISLSWAKSLALDGREQDAGVASLATDRSYKKQPSAQRASPTSAHDNIVGTAGKHVDETRPSPTRAES